MHTISGKVFWWLKHVESVQIIYFGDQSYACIVITMEIFDAIDYT